MDSLVEVVGGRRAEGRVALEPGILPGDAADRRLLGLGDGVSGLRSLTVNATPIVADDGTRRGVLATFDDLTNVEKKNAHLRRLLERLKHSARRFAPRRVAPVPRDPRPADLVPESPSVLRAVRTALEGGRTGQAEGFSCVMLDIDHFKSINDRHGHAVGDVALKEVSEVLWSLRDQRPGFRYGGEEFCVVLPGTGLEEAGEVAERYRQGIESRRFAGISATASFGVSSLDLDAGDPHGLINQADQALYAAKRTGQNRVVRFETGCPTSPPRKVSSPPRALPHLDSLQRHLPRSWRRRPHDT